MGSGWRGKKETFLQKNSDRCEEIGKRVGRRELEWVIAQTLGMTAEDIYQGYVKKNEVNHKRQDSGYAVKDHADSRHI